MRSKRRRAPAARRTGGGGGDRVRVVPRERRRATSPDMRLLRKSESWTAPPIKERWNSQSNKPGANCRVARVGHNCAENYEGRGENEKRRCDRITRYTKGSRERAPGSLLPAPIHEQRRRRQSKEDPIPERHVIHQLPERPGQGQ